jgi:hypothetical protein
MNLQQINAHDNPDNALVSSMDRLVSDLDAMPGQQHGVELTVWYSGNDGCWKWSDNT